MFKLTIDGNATYYNNAVSLLVTLDRKGITAPSALSAPIGETIEQVNACYGGEVIIQNFGR